MSYGVGRLKKVVMLLGSGPVELEGKVFQAKCRDKEKS